MHACRGHKTVGKVTIVPYVTSTLRLEHSAMRSVCDVQIDIEDFLFKQPPHQM